LAAVPLKVRVEESVAAAAFTVPVNVGDAENTAFPVPVSSERSAASCAEVENAEERPKVEVATQLKPEPVVWSI
jgi:hypothetical protein